MIEKDFFKKVIEEKMIQKEDIKNNILINILNKEKKGGESLMRKRLFIPAIASVICLAIISISLINIENHQYNQAKTFLSNIGIQADELAREDAKRIYNDIEANDFKCEITKKVLTNRAIELGIEIEPKSINVKQIYDSIINYDYSTDIKKVTSQQVIKIAKGMSYRDIVIFLGSTKNVGSGRYVLIYEVDNSKYLYLSFGKDSDICDQSGEELLKTLIDIK